MNREMIRPRSPESEGHEEEMRQMLEHLGLTLQDIRGDILDIGCGDGELVAYLRKKTGAEIVGVDLHPGEAGSELVQQGDAQSLPFPPDSFDMAFSHASIPNVFLGMYDFDDPETSTLRMKAAILKSIEEAVRVLRSGGSARFSPVSMGDLYPSEQARSAGIREALEEIKKVADVEFTQIGVDDNPDNGEKRDLYRIVIKKK